MVVLLLFLTLVCIISTIIAITLLYGSSATAVNSSICYFYYCLYNSNVW